MKKVDNVFKIYKEESVNMDVLYTNRTLSDTILWLLQSNHRL